MHKVSWTVRCRGPTSSWTARPPGGAHGAAWGDETGIVARERHRLAAHPWGQLRTDAAPDSSRSSQAEMDCARLARRKGGPTAVLFGADPSKP